MLFKRVDGFRVNSDQDFIRLVMCPGIHILFFLSRYVGITVVIELEPFP